MPTAIPVDFRAFVSETVNLSRERLENVRATVNHLKEQLQVHVRDRGDFALVGILNSGSVEKKTAVTPLNDVDVAVLLRLDRVPADQQPRLLEHVRELLIQVYHPKSRDDFSLARHAVRIAFHGANLSVDVVPLIPDIEDPDIGLLASRDSGEWVPTSIPLHLEFIRRRIREHPGFLELVRLTKWWRNEQGVQFKSFLIELLWAHLLDTRTVTGDDLGEALLGFFGYVVRTGLQQPITFPDYGQGEVPETVTDPVRVLDPVNAENNVAARIDTGRREALVAACRTAFEAIAAAQTAPTTALARGYYRRVFGPRFDLPRDVPGQVTAPHSKDHVTAKILADLRQLRWLHGGFDPAAEARYASALSLWIDRGLAAVVELVYSVPSTNDRLLSLRYTIDQDREVSTDHDPAGIPVHALDASRFGVYVTGNEVWQRMGEEAKAAFYKELGGWGPASRPLGEGQGSWSPDRVYARGKLVAVREIFRASDADPAT